MNESLVSTLIILGVLPLLVAIHVVTWHFSDTEIEAYKRQRICLIIAALALLAAGLSVQHLRLICGGLIGAGLLVGVHVGNVMEWMYMARMSPEELAKYRVKKKEASDRYIAQGI